MRLLIVTQVVDKNDPVLGFFHRWIEELATQYDTIEVICLQKGEFVFPESVRVFSLGKERGASRPLRIARFLYLAATRSHRAESILVHMNPEYVVLAGWFWRLLGKRVGLWYNHEVASQWFSVAQHVANVVFHTSPFAASARARHARRMPAGIDTKLFAKGQESRVPNSIYFQGRVAPAKRVHVLLEAVRRVRASGILATLTVVGPCDPEYAEGLRSQFKELFAAGAVSLRGPVVNERTPTMYASHTVSVNLTAAGNYDKTVLESASCETPVIVGSAAFAGLVPSEWVVEGTDPEQLARALREFLQLPEAQQRALGHMLRARVVEQHSLEGLARELYAQLNPEPIL